MSKFERVAVVTELAIVGLTLAITSITAWCLYKQTSRHFALERTTYLIERFNKDELVDARFATDRWLESDNCKDLKKCAGDLVAQAEEPANRDTFNKIRLFCNFFQELGTAAKHDTLDERYMWDVFGYNVSFYGDRLKYFVEELRNRKNRPHLYQEFIQLIEKMKKLDKKYGHSSEHTLKRGITSPSRVPASPQAGPEISWSASFQSVKNSYTTCA